MTNNLVFIGLIFIGCIIFFISCRLYKLFIYFNKIPWIKIDKQHKYYITSGVYKPHLIDIGERKPLYKIIWKSGNRIIDLNATGLDITSAILEAKHKCNSINNESITLL